TAEREELRRLRGENQTLRQERGILKGRCLLREGGDPVRATGPVAAERAAYPVSLPGRVLGVDYRVPPELAHLVAMFDGSSLVDRARGEVTARCDSEAANAPGLDSGHEPGP